MSLYPEDFNKFDALPAVEINVRPNILYTDEYSYITKDELEVLFLLAATEMSAEGMTSFSFSGIKRQLGKHQQKLTKAINRLIAKNLIQKNGDGYSLSRKGTTILSEIIKMQNAIDLHKSSEHYLEQKMFFNKPISLTDITTLLIGKWFGSFRYVSHTEGKSLVIRWQLLDSRATAILRIFNQEAILSIIPDKNDPQYFQYEQALVELSNYLIEIFSSLGISITFQSEEWKDSSISEIDYAQKLSSWLRSNGKSVLAEN